jgi:hypothetical protein
MCVWQSYLLLAALTGVQAVPAVPPAGQQPMAPPAAECRLSPADIQRLIQEGTKRPQGGFREPEPVKLQFGALRHFTVGAVYAPERRVRIAARAAQLAYRPFTQADVTSDLCQDLTIVSATPWVGHSVTAIVLLPVGASDPAQAIQPRWTRPFDVVAPVFFGTLWLSLPHLTLIQTLPGGADLQQGLVAAFDPSAFEVGREVVIVYDGRFNKQTGFGRTNEYRFPVQPDWR